MSRLYTPFPDFHRLNGILVIYVLVVKKISEYGAFQFTAQGCTMVQENSALVYVNMSCYHRVKLSKFSQVRYIFVKRP